MNGSPITGNNAGVMTLTDEPLETTVCDESVRFGKIKYELDGGVSGTDINVNIDVDQIRYYGPKLLNGFKVTYENDQDAPENVSFKGNLTTNVTGNPAGVAKTYYSNLGEEVTVETSKFWTLKGASNLALYSKKSYITVTYPSQAELVKAAPFSLADTPNDNLTTSFAGIKGVFHEPDQNRVTFYYKDSDASKKFKLTFKFEGSKGAVSGGEYKVLGAVLNYTTYDDTDHVMNATDFSGSQKVIIPSNNDNLLGYNQFSNRNVGTTAEDSNGTPMTGYTAVHKACFSNDKGRELTNQAVTYQFPEDIKARGLDIPIDKATRVSFSGITYNGTTIQKNNVTVSKETSAGRAKITPQMLGIGGSPNEILKELTVEVGDFGTDYSQGTYIDDGCYIYGNISKGTTASQTITYTINAVGGTTGLPRTSVIMPAQSSNGSQSIAYYNNEGSASNLKTAVNAGEDVPAWGTFRPYPGLAGQTMQRMQDPVIYVLLPDGMNVKNGSVKIRYSGGYLNSGDVNVSPVQTKQDPGNPSKTIRYVKIQTSNLILGKVNENLGDYGAMTWSMKLTTSKHMRTYNGNLIDLISIGPKEADANRYNDKDSIRFSKGSVGTTVRTTPDIYDLNGNGISSSENFSIGMNDARFSVTEEKGMIVNAEIKGTNESDSAYRTYDGTDGSKVTFTPDSVADYRVTVDNTNDIPADVVKVFVPVPKKGKTMGDDFQSTKSAWDMVLSGEAISTGEHKDKFEMLYGVIGASDNPKDESLYKTEGQVSSFDDVNMVLIRNKSGEKIPAESKTVFNFIYDISVTPLEASQLTGTSNIFNPFFTRKFDNTELDQKGASVAGVLQLASINGMIFINQNPNGIYNDQYDKLYTTPVTVTLANYPSSYSGATTTASINGKYEFTGLVSGDYDIKVDLPDGYIFTKTSNVELGSKVNKNGEVKNVDSTLPATSRNVHAGLVKHTSPVVSVSDIDTTVNRGYTPSTSAITSMKDSLANDIAKSKSSLEGHSMPSPLVAGTYVATYKAIDDYGKSGYAAQKIKVHGMPFVASNGGDKYYHINSTPSLDTLKSNVSIKYKQASNTISGNPFDTVMDTEFVTEPNRTQLGKKNVVVQNSKIDSIQGMASGLTKGAFDFYLVDKPVISAKKSDNTLYDSGAPTNKDVTITAQAISGLTLEYRVDNGAWKSCPGSGVNVSTSGALSSVYEFRYAESASAVGANDSNSITRFNVDMNKNKPNIVVNSNNVSSGSAFTSDKLAPTIDYLGRWDASSYIKYSKNGGVTDNYSIPTDLTYGKYVFYMKDKYGNTNEVAFTLNTELKVIFNGGTGGTSTASQLIVTQPSFTSISDAGLTMPTASKANHYFTGWNTDANGNGSDFTKSTKVTNNMEVYAQYGQKVDLVFKPKSAPSVTYNGNSQSTIVDVEIKSGSLLSQYGHTYNTVTAEAVGKDAGSYETTFSGIKMNNGSGAMTAAEINNFYNVKLEPGNFIISPKTLTIKPNDVTKKYDTSAIKATAYSANGLVGPVDEIKTVTYKGSQTIPGTASSSIDTVQIAKKSNGQSSNHNYSLTKNTGKLTITKGDDLDVSIAGNSTTYDGKLHSLKSKSVNKKTPGVTYYYSTSKNGKYTKSEPQYKDVDNYDVWVKAESDYYNQTDPKKSEISITKREITVKPEDVTATYTGRSVSPQKDAKVIKGNLVSGQRLDLSDAKFSGARTQVGTNDIKVNDVKVSGGNTKNYKIDYTNGTMTIKSDNTGGGGGGTITTPPTPDPRPDDPTPPPVNDDQTDTETNVSTTPVTNNGASDMDRNLKIAKDQGIPTLGIGDNEVPLYGNSTYDSWSLINLIICIGGLLLALVAAVQAMMRGKELIMPMWLIIAGVAMVIDIIVFFLTSDLSGIMTLFDGWTIIVSILLIVETFSIVKGFKREYGFQDDIDMNL